MLHTCVWTKILSVKCLAICHYQVLHDYFSLIISKYGDDEIDRIIQKLTDTKVCTLYSIIHKLSFDHRVKGLLQMTHACHFNCFYCITKGNWFDVF